MSMSNKPYKCADCGVEFETDTNHHKSTWNNCKVCRNQNSRSLCMTEEGSILREEGRTTITTQIVCYRYDVCRPDHRVAHELVLDTLAEMRTKLGGVLKCQANSTKLLVGKYGIEKCGETTTSDIELNTDYLYDNQWLTPDGPRVFDSHEVIYPNKDIKEGYYLVITDEIRALRHNRLRCGYCGHQEDEGDLKVGDTHCDKERVGSSPESTGLMRRVRKLAKIERIQCEPMGTRPNNQLEIIPKEKQHE